MELLQGKTGQYTSEEFPRCIGLEIWYQEWVVCKREEKISYNGKIVLDISDTVNINKSSFRGQEKLDVFKGY